MQQRPLGGSGLTVSALGFGAGAVGGLLVRGTTEEQQHAVARAIEAGVTYFDTAALYGDGRSEENLGRALTALNAWQRVIVGTKVRLTAADLADPAAAIRRSAEASLRRLGRASVDLFQLHNRVGSTTSQTGDQLALALVEGPVLAGLEALVTAGLSRRIGITGLGESAALTALLHSRRLSSIQCYFNPLNASAGYAGASGGSHDFGGLIDQAASAGAGVIVIRALAAGALGGSTARHANAGDPGAILADGGFAADVERARRLAPLVASLGLENGYELAIRFALAKPGVSTVLVGYSDLAQLEDALRWAARGGLPAAAVAQIVAAAG